MNTQKPSGINCPQCTFFIPLTITDLLYRDGVVCPCCSLTLTTNKEASRQALEALQRVQHAQDRLKATEKFNR